MPTISIGMPVYNSERTLESAISSVLSQTFKDFELIISDNCSTDNTEKICRQFASVDNRINYIRQPVNKGAYNNFKFVFDEASCEYFLWAAADDVRDNDFLEVNYKFLSKNPDYVASTSPNRMDGNPKIANFTLEGNTYERFLAFFDNCWVSHGMFYSLLRTKTLRNCEIVGQSFIGADWAIILYLAVHGKLHRTQESFTLFGSGGVSSLANPYKAFRNRKIEYVIPLYRLCIYIAKITRNFSLNEKIKIALILAKLNLKADYDQVIAKLYSIYCKHFRHLVRR